MRFVFQDSTLEVRSGTSEDPQENVIVGGESAWEYSSFTNWEFWWPKFPVLVYFKVKVLSIKAFMPDASAGCFPI